MVMEEPFHKHASLYLSDGNIAISVPRASGGEMIFRVHQSMLAMHSKIFADMFSLPQSDEAEKYDGIPLVRLSDDAEGFEGVLKAMYHHQPSLSRLDPRTPALVKPLLSLYNKYEMHHFRAPIVQTLEADWPQSLAQWDMLEAEIRWYLRDYDDLHGEYRVRSGGDDDCLPEPVSAITLARECNIPSILPAAFYHLSRLSIFDDEACYGDNATYACDDRGKRLASWGRLSGADYVCLLKGRAELAEAPSVLLQLSDSDGDKEIHWPGGCDKKKRIALFKEIRDECSDSLDILATLRTYLEQSGFGDKICSTCSSRIKGKLANIRETLWNELPMIFYLD